MDKYPIGKRKRVSLIALFSLGSIVLFSLPVRARDSNICYEIYENRDSPGYDMGDTFGQGLKTFFGGFDEDKLMKECGKSNCMGFNTDGILKYRIRDSSDWIDYSGSLYVKVPCKPSSSQMPALPVKTLDARMIAANLNNRADCFCNRAITTPSEARLLAECRGPKDFLYATYFIQCLDKIDFCSKDYKFEYENECQNSNAYTWLTESCRDAITPSCIVKQVAPSVVIKPMTATAIAANLNNRMDCFCEDAAFIPRAAGIERACKAQKDLVNATYFIECLDGIDFCAEDEGYYESECQHLNAYKGLSVECRNAITPSCK